MSELVKRLEAIIPYWPTHEQDLWDAIAEIKRLTAASEWQAIETAPKDGTVVLGCDENDSDYYPFSMRLCELALRICARQPIDN